jgi:hypothetical protein
LADASRVCGAGETVTRSPASAAETFSVGGTHDGDDAVDAALRPLAECADGSSRSPTPPSTSSPLTTPNTAAARERLGVLRTSL